MAHTLRSGDLLDSQNAYQLHPTWDWQLIALSYIISVLGAYTATQIIVQANNVAISSEGSSRRRRALLLAQLGWFSLAALCFGGCSIWCTHFVGMMAMNLGIPVTFNVGLTLLSAVFAIFGTFAVFSYENIFLMAQGRKLKKLRDRTVGDWLRGADDSESARDIENVEEGRWNESSGEYVEHGELAEDENEEEALYVSSASRRASLAESNEPLLKSTNEVQHNPSRRPSLSKLRELWHFRSAASSESQSVLQSANQSDVGTSASKNGELESHSAASESGQDEGTSTVNHQSSDTSSRLARIIGPYVYHYSRHEPAGSKVDMEDAILAKGWSLHAIAKNLNRRSALKGLLLALSVCTMHYMGMAAMIIEGYIQWNKMLVLLSFFDAWAVATIAVITIPAMASDIGKQFAFSLTAAAGVAIMHYTGMMAATFYTTLPPPYDKGGYPRLLPTIISTIAIATCFLSFMLLNHTATLSRNRLALMILTKRKMWKMKAEKEAAEQANKVKTDFISVASHEIRTPLHTVSGYADLLICTNLNEEQSLYLDHIRAACQTIQLLTENVLDFSKLERGNAETNARPIELDFRRLAVNAISACLSHSARGETISGPEAKPGVRVILCIQDEIPETVFLDEVYSTRVLMNLVANALKFTSSGHVLVSCTRENSDYMQILVMDSGEGIEPSSIKDIFEPFRQADSSLTRKHTGSGLGLAICKQLIVRMKGSIDLSSKLGEGTQFTLRLPLRMEAEGDTALTRPALERKTSAMSKSPRLKIFWSHPGTAAVLQIAWSRRGYTVEIYDDSKSLKWFLQDAEIIWSDLTSISAYPALSSHIVGMDSEAATSLVPFVVPYLSDNELLHFDSVKNGANVILVKGLITIHTIHQWLKHPESKMGRDGKRLRERQRSVHFKESDGEPMANDLPKRPSPAQSLQVPLTVHMPVISPPIAKTEEITLLAQQPTAPEMHKGLVLLVEDNMINQRLGIRILKKLGYEAMPANNGQEAVDKVASHRNKIAVVLMDCQMPVMDGFQATRLIRQAEKENANLLRLPIIAMTANVSRDVRLECEDAGMDIFMSKPLSIGDIENMAQWWESYHSPSGPRPFARNVD